MISQEISFDFDSNNIALLIGKNGSSLKKLIFNMKKNIINKNKLTSEEWESIPINIKFEKDDNKIKAIIECKEEHIENSKKILTSYINHFKNKNTTLIYRIGAEHHYISKMIGISGTNIVKLKESISELSDVNKVINIKLKEQNKRYNISFRNIGKKDIDEHIMLFIKIDGKIKKYDEIQKIVEDYINEYIYE